MVELVRFVDRSMRWEDDVLTGCCVDVVWIDLWTRAGQSATKMRIENPSKILLVFLHTWVVPGVE